MYMFVLSTTVLCGQQNPTSRPCLGRTYSCSGHRASGLGSLLTVPVPRVLILHAGYVDAFGLMVRKFDIKANKLRWPDETVYQSSSELVAWRGSWVKCVCKTTQQKLAAQNSVLNSHLHLGKRISAGRLLPCLNLNLHLYGGSASTGLSASRLCLCTCGWGVTGGFLLLAKVLNCFRRTSKLHKLN